MGKKAFLFSGQGAQYVGMGKDIYECSDKCKEIFKRASNALQIDLKSLCFAGPLERLNITEYTQPAVVTVTLAILEMVKERGISPDVVAGLSLGEYSALTAAGVFDLETVVSLVRKRGRYMQEAVPVGMGKMAAMIGGTPKDVRALCETVKDEGFAAPTNYNCPGQIVIGGETKAVEKAMSMAKKYGIVKAIELPVSAPFHTKMLAPAAEKLEEELKKIDISKPVIPVVCNISARYLGEEDNIKDILREQVMSPVLWEQSVGRMIADGVDTFIEIGPGTIITGFVKKIDRNVKALHIGSVKDLNDMDWSQIC